MPEDVRTCISSTERGLPRIVVRHFVAIPTQSVSEKRTDKLFKRPIEFVIHKIYSVFVAGIHMIHRS